MPYRLTSAQRWVLADCVRTGLVGWLITCPVAGPRCHILQARATSVLGFGFSRFTTMAAAHFGSDYRPRRPGSTGTFPLSIAEAAALAAQPGDPAERVRWAGAAPVVAGAPEFGPVRGQVRCSSICR